VELGATECGLDYRTSVFRRPGGARWIVLGVRFSLQPDGPPAVRYPELQRALGGRAGTPSLAEVRQTVLSLRREKAMVIDPADPESRSAGSFFLNVVLDRAGLSALVERGRQSGALSAGEEPPGFSAAGGRTKVPAAWLIERSGCRRGEALGGAHVSHKHALALVNGGAATAADVVALARRVQARVRDAFGVELEPEPVLAGFEG
jgi:UDP-N-acetylmuramate dehydrogenase